MVYMGGEGGREISYGIHFVWGGGGGGDNRFYI